MRCRHTSQWRLLYNIHLMEDMAVWHASTRDPKTHPIKHAVIYRMVHFIYAVWTEPTKIPNESNEANEMRRTKTKSSNTTFCSFAFLFIVYHVCVCVCNTCVYFVYLFQVHTRLAETSFKLLLTP